MRINPTPQQLVAFLRVAETASFSRAAGALGISQPSLSRTIKAIESAIGARVFNRDTRNVELTSVGAELRLIATRMVKEYEGALSELTQFVEGQRGQITVAALPSIAAVLLPRALVCFRETNPGIDVAIRDSLSQPVLTSVLEGTADFGLTVRPAPSARLTYKPLVEDEFCLICRSDDPLADSEGAAWSVFVKHPFIAMSAASSVRTMTDAAFLQAGLAVRQLYECAHLATAGGLVAAGLGITALPRLALPIVGDSLVSQTLKEPTLIRSIGMVTRAGEPLTRAGHNFLAALEAEVRLLARRGKAWASLASRGHAIERVLDSG